MLNLKVVYFGASYALIFSGYYVITSFLNIVYQKDAFISFAIFYSVYAVVSLIGVLVHVPPKVALFVSSLSFVFFICAASSGITTLMLVASGISGAGNAFVWLIQGVWIASFSEESQGNLMGIFYAVFCTDLIVGNLLGLGVLLANVPVQTMMWIMLIPTGIGTIMTLFIPFNSKESNKPNAPNSEQPIEPTKDVIEDVKGLKELLKEILKAAFDEKKGYFIIPLMMAQSIGLVVTYQILPKLILINAGPTQGPIYNTGVFLAYGVSSIGFSFVWGRLYDKFTWKSVIFPYLILELACLTGVLVLSKSYAAPAYWIVIGFGRGIIDYAINNALNIIISTKYQPVCGPMFGLFRCVYAVSYVAFSVSVGYLTYEWILLICAVFCIASTLSIVLFFRYTPD